MGSLKPGVTYIYEKANGITYARESGSTDRQIIGWDIPDRDREIYKSISNNYWSSKLWTEILKEAETNPTLQQAVDRVIMLYKLSVSKYD